MKSTTNILGITLGSLVIISLIFAIPWFICHCSTIIDLIILPPKEVNLCQIRLNNFTNNSAGTTSFGVSVMSSIVSMVGLSISVLGVFITMLVITIGNYRQQFYDTLWKCRDKNEYVNKKTLDVFKERHKKLNENAVPLQKAFGFAVILMLIGLLSLSIIIIVQKLIFDNIWMWLWIFSSIFVSLLFLATTYICYMVLRTVSYPDMKDIQKGIGDKIILHLEESHSAKEEGKHEK